MGVDVQRQDARIDGLRKGSIAMVCGWAVLAMSGMFGVFFFQSLRDGTDLMKITASVMGALGVILLAVGTRMRHANG